MNTEPTIRKMVQVAEQTQLPIHVPVVLGNECFIITQQDMRRIEDSRIYSYRKVNSKGELVPMDTTECNIPSKNTGLHQMQYQSNAGPTQLHASILQEIIARTYNAIMTMQQQQQQQQAGQITMPDILQCIQQQIIPNNPPPTPMAEFAPTAATLQQQLDWAKACEAMLAPTAMHPLHHTSATSTTEIGRSQCMPQSNATNKRQCCTRGCNTMDIDEDLTPFSYSPLKLTSRSETCLSARHQAKQRKMAQFGN